MGKEDLTTLAEERPVALVSRINGDGMGIGGPRRGWRGRRGGGDVVSGGGAVRDSRTTT
jgi:hypothetical protein